MLGRSNRQRPRWRTARARWILTTRHTRAHYTRLLLNAYDPLVLGPIARSSGDARRLDSWSDTAAHPQPPPGCGSRHRLLPRAIRSPRWQPGDDPRPQPERPPSCLPAPGAAGHHGGRNRRPQAASCQRTVRVRRAHLVIHCLPGPLTRKAMAVANVAAVLAPNGVLFGASVLWTSGHHTWLARRFLAIFNRQGGFDNLDDTEDGLREILAALFERVELETVGSAAISRRRIPARTRRTDSARMRTGQMSPTSVSVRKCHPVRGNRFC